MENCVVAICSYKRPGSLRQLLIALSEIDFSIVSGVVRVLVVDNDGDGSAVQPVKDLQSQFPEGVLDYMNAAPKGLVVARNSALDYGKNRDAAVIFIDDDEVPGRDWFKELWRMHLTYPHDVIAGPVEPKYEDTLPAWCLDGKFWERPSYGDGEVLRGTVGDGNILYPQELVSSSIRYSMKFNTSGAQDTHLLRRWLASGMKIRWAARASVVEVVPRGRMSVEYLSERAFFSALSYVWVDREFGASAIWTLARGVRLTLCALFHRIQGIATGNQMLSIKSLIAWGHAKGTFFGLVRNDYDRYGKYQIDATI